MVALAGPGWRLASSLVSLMRETDTRAPDRSTASDGSIGDPAHSSRDSDHNPDGQGFVDAVDITDDPANGCNVQELIDGIVARRDRRLGYAIHKGRIWRGYDKPGIPAFTPVPYTGPNRHDHHVHISVADEYRPDLSPWWPKPQPVPPPPPPPTPPENEVSYYYVEETKRAYCVRSHVTPAVVALTPAERYELTAGGAHFVVIQKNATWNKVAK